MLYLRIIKVLTVFIALLSNLADCCLHQRHYLTLGILKIFLKNCLKEREVIHFRFWHSSDNRDLEDLEEEDESVRLARFHEAASQEISERMQASMNLMMGADREKDDGRSRGGGRGRGGEDEGEEDEEEEGRQGEEDSEQKGK